jgi:hypothetical protein
MSERPLKTDFEWELSLPRIPSTAMYRLNFIPTPSLLRIQPPRPLNSLLNLLPPHNIPSLAPRKLKLHPRQQHRRLERRLARVREVRGRSDEEGRLVEHGGQEEVAEEEGQGKREEEGHSTCSPREVEAGREEGFLVVGGRVAPEFGGGRHRGRAWRGGERVWLLREARRGSSRVRRAGGWSR